ncbi:MAG: hypothetical protein LC746_05050 [Acidobacteria bacterium]|nr:hypothetical protein [Acidobacteriota bacterium]
MEERLQKLIAAAGLASRRHAEELIAAGEVTVNGEIVTEPGTKADPARDHIKAFAPRPRGSSGRARPSRTPGSRSCCTRGATSRSGGCSTPSVTPS